MGDRFGHNSVGEAGFPSNTKSPGSRPIFVPSGILIHPAIWPQQTWAEKLGGAVPHSVRGAGYPSSTMSPGLRLISVLSGTLIHSAVWRQEIWAAVYTDTDKVCVHCPIIDYTKAFDTVRHSTLMEKLAQRDLPDSV